MNKNYLIVDAMNTFFRSLHVPAKGSDLEERVAYAIHVMIQSLIAMGRDHKSDHAVIALDGHSWRKTFYPRYKAQRIEAREAKTEKEQEEMAAFFDAYIDLIEFFREKTNVTVLHNDELEADDLIGGWIQCHPDDNHTVISTDSDFYQLLAENVSQYSGVLGQLHTIHGIYDKKGKLVIDKKTKLPKAVPDPKFLLFEKCMRGDVGDNVFSAFPNVRTKGTKNKPGLIEAFADRDSKGYDWNNVMLQRWVDHENVEHKVLDDYIRNEILIDLSKQPVDIRAKIEETVLSAPTKSNSMVGAHFLKFCGRYNLENLSKRANDYSNILKVPYEGK